MGLDCLIVRKLGGERKTFPISNQSYVNPPSVLQHIELPWLTYQPAEVLHHLADPCQETGELQMLQHGGRLNQTLFICCSDAELVENPHSFLLITYSERCFVILSHCMYCFGLLLPMLLPYWADKTGLQWIHPQCFSTETTAIFS